MRLNEDIVLVSSITPAVLVPYKAMHVPNYHKWMQSPELLELTASEPLSIEEEYENMRSWREDDKKISFIILDRSIASPCMAGDVNLYMLKDDEQGQKVAEVEVMIAETRFRRKGLAKDALSMMMAYATQHLPIHVFVAKVLEHNMPSIALFSKALCFEEECRVQAFNEIHYKLHVNGTITKAFAKTRETWSAQSFTHSIYSKEAIHCVVDGSTPAG